MTLSRTYQVYDRSLLNCTDSHEHLFCKKLMNNAEDSPFMPMIRSIVKYVLK